MAAPLEVIGPRAGSAPLTYTLTEVGAVDLQSIFASFNGAGAGGSFRPALTIRAQNGAILARTFPSETLAAGDSADVTYAPFLRAGIRTPGGITVLGARVEAPFPSTIAVPNGLGYPTTIPYTVEHFDSGGMFNPAVPSRLTAPEAGLYLFMAALAFDVNATGDREFAMFKNGTVGIGGVQLRANAASGWSGFAAVVDNCAVGDFVTVRAGQSSGGSLNVTRCHFSAYALGVE